MKDYPLPSAGSEDVVITGGAQPKPRDTTNLQRRVWGSDVRLTRARATDTHLQKSAPCKRTLSTTHTNQGCVHTVKCFHRGHTIQYIPKFSFHKEHQISSCTKFGLCPHREVLTSRPTLELFTTANTCIKNCQWHEVLESTLTSASTIAPKLTVPRALLEDMLTTSTFFSMICGKGPSTNATVRCCTRSSISPARRFLSKLRHYEIVMRQSTKNYMDTNCRNRHERRDIKGARNKFVTSFRSSCAHQSPRKWPCRKRHDTEYCLK